MIVKRMKLGEMLLEANLISQDQLKQALEEQMKSRKRLGEILIDLKVIDVDVLVDFLSKQLDIPRVNLREVEIEKSAMELLASDFCKNNLVCPVAVVDGRLRLALSDPLNIFLIDEIEHRAGMKVIPMLENPANIKSTLDKVYAGDTSKLEMLSQELDEGDAVGSGEESSSIDLQKIEGPIVALAHQLLEKAIAEKASDIHVEPGERTLRVRFRVDGVLVELLKIPQSLQKFSSELVSRLKLMANMDISERRLPQDGRIRVTQSDRSVDMRVNTMPVAKGEKVCIRLLDASATKLEMKDLGFSDTNFELWEEIIRHPHGLVLVTGPTGSGKTSTLYAALNYVYTPEENTCTVEDPIEFHNPNFNQTQVRSNIGLTFAACLRAILRQDPDIILIGEIRDTETAKIAVESALTGHLVFSTLHTNSASATVARLVELDVEPYMVASTLLGVLAQRLCRRLCPKCKQERELPDEIKNWAISRCKMPGESALKRFLMEKLKDPAGRKSYIPGTCPNCKSTGYVGRMGIHELLTNSPELRKQVLEKSDGESIADAARLRGFVTLVEDGYQKVLLGRTSLDEVLRVAR